MSRKNADYVGRWNLRCVYRRCGDKWEIVEDHRNFIEQVSWDFQDDDTLVVREVGKNLFYRACVPDYRSKRLEMWRESHSLVSHYYHVSIDADAMRFYQYGNSYKDRDSRIFCLELVPQQDSLMQNTLNRIIGLTRLQSVTQYPIETIRSLRITDPDRQIILPDSDTGLFVSRMTDDHVAMAVFLHVFRLIPKYNNVKSRKTYDDFITHFVQYATAIDMWLTLYDHGKNMSRFKPLFLEGYIRFIAVMLNALNEMNIDYEAPFANHICNLKK